MSDDDRARWNAKYRQGSHGSSAPSAVLVSLRDKLPRTGRALDLAGGCGADAVWLAEQGLDVTLADVSDVALERAALLAESRDVSLQTVRADLGESPPAGPWDLVTCSNFLDRTVWRALHMAPGGVFVWIHPTVANLERHPKPSARFLLQPGEGLAIVGALRDVAIVEHREGWVQDRHLSVVVARFEVRPAPATNVMAE